MERMPDLQKKPPPKKKQNLMFTGLQPHLLSFINLIFLSSQKQIS